MDGEDLILSEVLARVAFRAIVWDFRCRPKSYDDPITGMYQLAVTLDLAGFRALAVWVSSAAFEVGATGMPLAAWRDSVIRRARLHYAYRRSGCPWRRAANPPVSNTGVSAGSHIVRRPWGRRRARWDNDPIR